MAIGIFPVDTGRKLNVHKTVFFFYLGFRSRTFTIHRTAGGEGGHTFNPSLPLPPASQTLRHQLGDQISSPLHIATSRTRTANLWFPSASRQPRRPGRLLNILCTFNHEAINSVSVNSFMVQFTSFVYGVGYIAVMFY